MIFNPVKMKFVVMCNPISGLPFLKRLIKLNIRPDLVVTHDPNEEYGYLSPKRFIEYH